MKRILAIGSVMALTSLGACTTDELAAISEGLAAGMAEASYGAPYGYNAYNSGPGLGNWVGYGQCLHSGSMYYCDTNGDGLADSYGNASTGTYSSSSLRINGRGEAYTWNTNKGEWVRNRAYDGPRDEGDHHHHHDRHD